MRQREIDSEGDSQTQRKEEKRKEKKQQLVIEQTAERLDVTTTPDFCEHCSEVAALLFGLAWRKLSGVESVKKRPLILRTGNTLSLAVQTHTFQA